MRELQLDALRGRLGDLEGATALRSWDGRESGVGTIM